MASSSPHLKSYVAALFVVTSTTALLLSSSSSSSSSASSATAGSLSPCRFPAIFNFGDSNSDTGGLSAAFVPAVPPNGETFFGAPAGRDCDGRLVIDFIAMAASSSPDLLKSYVAAFFVVTSTTTLLLSTSSATAGSLSPCRFPAIFNFGDSNSDTGGLSAAFGAAPPPNGETFFGAPAGRYCDGRLVIDFIAESLRLPYLSAYLNSMASNFSQGANFATAGSTIRRQNTTIFQSGYSPFSLDVQSWQFYQFQNRSQRISSQGGIFKDLMPHEDYFSRALYTFDIGQNDLTSGYFSNMTTEEVKATIPDILSKFKSAIQSVYRQGGRSFWIHNTGPFGCLPYVLERIPVMAAQVDRTGCGTQFNEVAQLFNKMLKETVVRLRKDLPLAAFTYVDVYSVKYSLISEATKHGFEHPLVACCGHGGKYNYNIHNGCGSKVVVNGTEVVLGRSCENPLTRINWDGVHYTEAANRWVFDRIAGGAFSDPPLPVRMACHR